VHVTISVLIAVHTVQLSAGDQAISLLMFGSRRPAPTKTAIYPLLRAMSGSGIVRPSALAALRFEGSRNRSRILEADALRGASVARGRERVFHDNENESPQAHLQIAVSPISKYHR
jgi:hypothetical protein